MFLTRGVVVHALCIVQQLRGVENMKKLYFRTIDRDCGWSQDKGRETKKVRVWLYVHLRVLVHGIHTALLYCVQACVRFIVCMHA